MKEHFPDYDKKAAIAAKYGWKISGWAVDLDNHAGISLYPIWGGEHLRMQHKDSLKVWETTLKKNIQKKPTGFKGLPKQRTFDDVVAENKVMRAALTFISTRSKSLVTTKATAKAALTAPSGSGERG